MSKKFFILGVASLFCAGLALAAYGVGDHVANFTEPDADNNSVSLYDYSGDVVMLTFWTHS